jgi:hypothetical protein
MLKNKNSVAESVADEMAAFLSSDECRAVFVRTAAKKEDKKEDKKAPPKGKKPKHNHDEDAKCNKKCPAFMFKKSEDLQSAVDTLSKISEVLDEYGFDKTASVTLLALNQLMVEAAEEDKQDKKDENEAKDVVVEVNDCGDSMASDDDHKYNAGPVPAPAAHLGPVVTLPVSKTDAEKAKWDLPHSADDALLTDEEKAKALQYHGDNAHSTTNPPVHPGTVPEATQHSSHPAHKNPYADKSNMVFENEADDGDSKKANPNSEEVSGEELRALLSELGLSSGTEGDDILAEASLKALDEDFADDYADLYVLPKEASFRNEIVKVAAEKSKPKGEFIFPADHAKVLDQKPHFPIDSESRGRNALAQASKFKKVPPWYKGSLESLVSTVQKAVKRKYKGIETTPASKNPGKG